VRHIRELAVSLTGPDRTDHQLLDDFARRGDQSAFVGLVERHGPMVLRVCRRVLRHEQDAEDAFQATFLVLVRSIGSIRQRQTLTNWLHGVASRTALETKRRAAQRRKHEARLRDRTRPPDPNPSWDDVQGALDEEIQRLPEMFRSAFVLCVLDGKTVSAAAAELGVKESTLSWRLARARERLRQRLTHRGIQLSAVLAALSLEPGACEATVPAELASATIRFVSVATDQSVAGTIPSHVAALAARVHRTMFLTKVKIATFACLLLGLVTTGLLACQALADKEEPQAATQKDQPDDKTQPKAAHDKDHKETVKLSGGLWDLEGNPVSGARSKNPRQNEDILNHDRFCVTIWTEKTRVEVGELFEVKLRVVNSSEAPLSFVVMNGSWDDHWQSSNPRIDCNRGIVRTKNFPVTVQLEPGEAYEQTMHLSVGAKGTPKTESFRMGFTPSFRWGLPLPFDRELGTVEVKTPPKAVKTYWSNEVVLGLK
jgi:RNA polymerase sigma factor (sigma-70 family)